jgi:hypothetical protein
MDKTRIFYYCGDHQRPTGGQKSMYKHVDILNHNGRDACVLHRQEGFSLSWFAHQTRVVGEREFRQIYRPATDILVLPESLGHAINEKPGRKVIFNQNCYYGFAAFEFLKPHPYPYLRPDLRGVMTVSEHNRRYLTFAFPHLRVRRVCYSVDPRVFVFNDLRQKKRWVTCLPSKNLIDLLQVYHLSQARAQQGCNRLNEYQWVFLKDKSEQEVAEILHESAFFLSLSTTEGLPRLPLEAMLSGSIVLGYGHGPLAEILRPDNSFPCEKPDVLSLVTDLETATKLFLTDPEQLRGRSEAARKTAGEYSCEREAQSCLGFWKEVLEEE